MERNNRRKYKGNMEYGGGMERNTSRKDDRIPGSDRSMKNDRNPENRNRKNGGDRKNSTHRGNGGDWRNDTDRGNDIDRRNDMENDGSMGYEEYTIEGRNMVIEAFRSGKTIDKLYIQDGCQDGPILTIKKEARKQETIIKYVTRERLDQISATGKHQGVIAIAAAYEYGEVEDILQRAREKQEPPFIILLDNIEDPHNLGAIIRSANLAGAHGVIIPKNRAVGLTAAVVRASAGALNYTPVAKVTNLAQTIESLKKEGIWFVCADMGGTSMYDLDLKGPIGLVIGNEGEGVGRLVKEKCDMTASIPMKGDIDSLNASVAAGVLAFEIVRQRMGCR